MAVMCSFSGCTEAVLFRGLCAIHYREAYRAKRGPCSVNGCGHHVLAVGLCSAHYSRQRRGLPLDVPFGGFQPRMWAKKCACGVRVMPGSDMCFKHDNRRRLGLPPDASTKEVKRRGLPQSCTMPGCAEPYYARGLCEAHNARRRRGSVVIDKPVMRIAKRGKVGSCSFDECPCPGYAKGFCRGHYAQLASGRALKRLRLPGRRIYLDENGYAVFSEGGKRRSVHRAEMEALLGRKLHRHENVHHRNGDRANNSIGPCATSNECRCVGIRHNLELWSKAQPCGQRVSDKVSYAVEILSLYAPTALASQREVA